MLKLMKNKPIVIISGDPKGTFNEILIKTLLVGMFQTLAYLIERFFMLEVLIRILEPGPLNLMPIFHICFTVHPK